MLLALIDAKGISIAQKRLETPADFRRIANASMLSFQGEYYGFTGIDEDVIFFEKRSSPVCVDGFVRKLPQ